MKWKLIEVTLPTMEDKPMSLNTQREQGPLIKLKGSWITQQHRRITHTKIQEIKLLYFLNKTQLDFIDKNGFAYIRALTIRITTDTWFSVTTPSKLVMNHSS